MHGSMLGSCVSVGMFAAVGEPAFVQLGQQRAVLAAYTYRGR